MAAKGSPQQLVWWGGELSPCRVLRVVADRDPVALSPGRVMGPNGEPLRGVLIGPELDDGIAEGGAPLIWPHPLEPDDLADGDDAARDRLLVLPQPHGGQEEDHSGDAANQTAHEPGGQVVADPRLRRAKDPHVGNVIPWPGRRLSVPTF